MKSLRFSVSRSVVRPVVKFASLCAVAVSMASIPGAATAESTKLQAFDGDISVHGTVMIYDGETYKVDTAIGVIWVDATVFRCLGTKCPPKAFSGIRTAKSLEKLGLGPAEN